MNIVYNINIHQQHTTAVRQQAPTSMLPLVSRLIACNCFVHTPYANMLPQCRIFGAPLTAASGDTTYSPATATLAPKATKSDTSDRGHVDADADSQPSLLALAAELHASVEQGDAEAVARVLSLSNHQRSGGDAQEGVVGDDAQTEQPQQRRGLTLPHLVDCACPRTGLTPLLKAVEGGSEEMVRLLLEAGGDVQSQVRGQQRVVYVVYPYVLFVPSVTLGV